MEGTISTMDEILKFEADSENDTNEAKNVRSEIFETILYQRALTNAQKAMNEGYPLSQQLVKTIHQQLLSFGRGAKKSPGQFKIEQNYLADKIKQKVLFVPVSPEKLNDGLGKLFEYISGYMEENKDEYIDTMRNVSENNDWEKWCIFFLNAVEKQAIRNLEIAENIKNLYEEMKHIFSDTLSSKWSVNALDYIFTNPIFRNNRFTSKSGIPGTTAARFTRMLLEKELIRTLEEASGRRPALYAFEPLLKLVRV